MRNHRLRPTTAGDGCGWDRLIGERGRLARTFRRPRRKASRSAEFRRRWRSV